MTKINIASTNPVKINATKRAFEHYFENLEINSIETDSGVSAHPISAEETMQGAKTRAQNAFNNCDYSIGIEAGMIRYPTESGYIMTANVAIYDGKNFFVGACPLLELPKNITQQIVDGGELGPIMDQLHGQKDTKKGVGTVGILTKGVLTREEAIKQGVLMALCPIINKDLYQ
jgi:inosine/xanthosine triphosphatase